MIPFNTVDNDRVSKQEDGDEQMLPQKSDSDWMQSSRKNI